MLAYLSPPYTEVTDIQPALSYIPYATSLILKNCDIITFIQFEEEELSFETRDNAESDKNMMTIHL